MVERDAFEEWWKIRWRQGGTDDQIARAAFERTAMAEHERAFEEWYATVHGPRFRATDAKKAYARSCFTAGARSRDAEVDGQAETLRQSLAALWDLSDQLNRHRCGNWEPELKAADERARALLGDEG